GVTTGGRVFCWGDNLDGELGTGTNTGPQGCEFGRPCSRTPVPVVGGLTFTTVSAGASHACGVTSDGAAYCWGDNSAGALGDGTTTQRTAPVAVAGDLSFAVVDAHGQNACGVTLGGHAYCWGDNFAGQLGSGTNTASATPVQVVQ